MVIREGNECLEIEAIDHVIHGSPNAGDIEFSVAVSSYGFTGHGFGWVDFDSLANFIAQLSDLERNRRGAAELNGVSFIEPTEEFRLRIWSLDRWGHMAVTGRVTRVVHVGEAPLYPHAIEFGFEFDPTTLPGIVEGFREILEDRSP